MNNKEQLVILDIFGFTKLHTTSKEQVLSGQVQIALHDPLDGLYKVWPVSSDRMDKFVVLLFEYKGKQDFDTPIFEVNYEQQHKMVKSLSEKKEDKL